MNLSDDEEMDRLIEEATRRVVDKAKVIVEQLRMGLSIGYLSASELAELIDCKPNQRSKMATWLKENKWHYEVSSSGLPKVARAYHDRKMGIIDGPVKSKFTDEPNFGAFNSQRGGPQAQLLMSEIFQFGQGRRIVAMRHAISWVTIEKYIEITGERFGTVAGRRESGEWVDGHHWKLVDGDLWISLSAVDAWVAAFGRIDSVESIPRQKAASTPMLRMDSGGDLWDMGDIAAYLKRITQVVRESMACLPPLPQSDPATKQGARTTAVRCAGGDRFGGAVQG